MGLPQVLFSSNVLFLRKRKLVKCGKSPNCCAIYTCYIIGRFLSWQRISIREGSQKGAKQGHFAIMRLCYSHLVYEINRTVLIYH